MRRFSFRPSLTLRGRTFKGLRGWAGKPLHPPLTAIPVGAYALAAAFDVISYVGKEQEWARDFFRAGTFALVGGAILSVFTVLTGFWDWLRSTEPGTQARRTANAHAITMLFVTGLVFTGILLRLVAFDGDTHTPVLALVLSVASVLFVGVGGTIGGSLTYDYGFNVETAGDHPVWHRSERDVLPGEKHGE
ncbi:MAG: DUF2231 domain-containing protein [Actinomycetota bacterium]